MKNIENFITLKSTIDTLNIYLNRVIVVVFNIKTNLVVGIYDAKSFTPNDENILKSFKIKGRELSLFLDKMNAFSQSPDNLINHMKAEIDLIPVENIEFSENAFGYILMKPNNSF